MKVYICGPMTGFVDFNRESFVSATRLVRDRGHTAVSPVELNTDEYGYFPSRDWQGAMRVDIAALMKCDIILLLEGWENSKGATLEHIIATQVGIMAVPIRNFLESY